MQPYSHYVAFFSDYRNPIDFMRFVSDARILIDHAPREAMLCGEHPHMPPVINEQRLAVGSRLNTSPFSLLKLSLHDPWPAHRFPLSIIRTDRLAYDTVICACLMAFRHHFGAAEITSDGTKEEWKNAIAMYEFLLERPHPKMELR